MDVEVFVQCVAGIVIIAGVVMIVGDIVEGVVVVKAIPCYGHRQAIVTSSWWWSLVIGVRVFNTQAAHGWGL